jgi:putative FmdB family regulatory protein
MPIFEYACQDCGHEFEALTRSSDQPQCPRCHSIQLAKKLSVFATASSGEGREPAFADGAPGPCGSCGHPGGPGACSLPN